jgi:hypothetical protein
MPGLADSKGAIMDSSTTALIIAAIIAIALVLTVTMIMRGKRTDTLRSKFGPEYDRALEEGGDKRKAEAELLEREKRVKKLDIRPLTASERDGFAASWQGVQAEFVDAPKTALANADTLLTQVMKARGYPMDNFEQRAADVSVDHPSVVQNYRAGRDIAAREKRGEANTEDMRQAMLHYRALFDELVQDVAATGAREAS